MQSSKSLDELVDAVRSRMITFQASAEFELEGVYPFAEIKVRPIYTFRDAEFQDDLYAQGRTKPGKIVTNAKGGDSLHQWRCAVDFGVWIDGKITYEAGPYEVMGRVAKEQGITWGGDWDADGEKDRNDWDLMHFQYTGGLTLAELKAGAQIG